MRLAPIIAFTFAASLGACSVVDGDDRGDLRAAIEKATPESQRHFAAMMANAKPRAWLDGRPPTETIISGQCRQRGSNGTWGPWSSHPAFYATVTDALVCMGRGVPYGVCISTIAATLETKLIESFGGAPNTNPDLECKAVIAPEYQPDQVPGGNADLERLNADDFINWLLAQKTAPPGFTPAEWLLLSPVICPMAEWGCFGDDGNPTFDGTISPAPDGES